MKTHFEKEPHFENENSFFRAIRGTSQERPFPPVESQPINGVSNQ